MLARGVALLAFACALLTVAPQGLADGDPASDTLLVQNVFLPYPAPSAAARTALQKVTLQ